jgi:dihydroxyacetone kinase-like protein
MASGLPAPARAPWAWASTASRTGPLQRPRQDGFGGTPLLELYLMVHAAHKVLAGAGVKVVRHLTGPYVTSLEMAGCSITVTALDEGTLALWDAPVHTAALRWGR